MHAEYTIGVIGCTGRGKTTFCNFLLKRHFKMNEPESPYAGWEGVCSITSEAQHDIVKDPVARVELHVIDMPGLLATENITGTGHADRAKDGRKLLEKFAKALDFVKDGIDVLFVTLKTHARMSAEEEFLLEFLDRLCLWPYCVLLFTHGSLAGEYEENRYDGLRKFIATDRCKVECPVMMKMLEKTKGRFVIVESVQQAGDPHYYRSKLDEIYGAIGVIRKDAGSAVSHPVFKMARESWESHQIILEDTDRLEKLIHGLQQYMQQSQSTGHILAQHLVNYLCRLEGNPELIVKAYSELETEVEELKANKLKLKDELAKFSEKGELVSPKAIVDSLNVILGDAQPTDDTMLTSPASPRDKGNIQEDNVQAAPRPKKCSIF